MKFKRGFTLIETIVALAIIVIITFCFILMSTYVTSTIQKSKIKALGIIQIESCLDVFQTTNFVSDGNFTVENFDRNLNFNFDSAINDYKTIAENTYNYCIPTDENFTVNDDGNIKFNLNLEKSGTELTFLVELYFNDDKIYEMPRAFVRVVDV